MRLSRTTIARCAGVARGCAAALLLSVMAGPLRAADATEQAREHFRKGQTHYALGEFEHAIAEYKEAYRLRSSPAILFNMAQAMRLLGQDKQAVFYYSQYLSQRPDAANRSDVEGWIASLRKRIAEQQAGGPMLPAAPRASDAIGAAAPGTGRAASATAGSSGAGPFAPAASPGRAQAPAAAISAAPPRTGMKATRIAGLAAMGAGVGAEVLAFVFHSSAQSAADQLNQKYGGAGYGRDDVALNDARISKGRLATVAAIGGAALIAAGAVATFAF